ncbi:hypothetical protein [Flavobacterium sp.]|uniref:hypothetical protein n=1 Tax=Flavobacterium sp. TaxID=239 RepID=UPI00286B29A1|nr:hypothetical protein [Flavobacterium sp.]
MKKILIIILFWSTVSFSQHQKLIATTLNKTPHTTETFVGIDGLGNYYSIKNNVFTKQNDHQSWEYKNISLGKITRVDFLNPLKILLFFESFNTVVTLDNQLNEIQKINFSDVNNSIVVTKIGMASQNQFWIYNALNQKIGLFDYTKNTYTPLGNPIEVSFKDYQSDFNTFYWIDEINNWYSCDIFGKVNLMASIPVYDKIQIIDSEKLLFSKGNKMYLLDNKAKVIIEIEIVEKSFQNFYYKDQILAIFTNQQITNYKIKLP